MNDCLWKIKLQKHKDARCKENARKKISEEKGLCVADCQKMWRRLRNKFVREENKSVSQTLVFTVYDGDEHAHSG